MVFCNDAVDPIWYCAEFVVLAGRAGETIDVHRHVMTNDLMMYFAGKYLTASVTAQQQLQLSSWKHRDC